MSELHKDEKLTAADIVNRQPVETNDGAASDSDTYANPHTDMRADTKYVPCADSSHDPAAATQQPNPLFPEHELSNFRSRVGTRFKHPSLTNRARLLNALTVSSPTS